MGFDETDWSSFLTQELGRSVSVEFGRARHRVLQAQPADRAAGHPAERRGLVVRMSSFFAEAPAEVREALAAWLRSGRRARRATAVLDRWIDASVARLPPPPQRRIETTTRGRHHDLSALAAELREREHAGLEPWPRITWGKRSRSRARRSLQLGCFVHDDQLVRVNPVLDSAWVPPWFVRYILFHELLHAALPLARDASGRVVHHGPAFRRRERSYADYERALAWQRRHLKELLRSARGLPPTVSRTARNPRARPAPRQGLLFPA